MSLSACKECGKEISDQAKACPHCGSPAPQPTSWVVKLLIGLFMGGLLISVLNGAGTGSNPSPPAKKQAVAAPPPPQKTPEELAAEEEACRQDFGCWVEKNLYQTHRCDKKIEQLAKYDLRWEQGLLDSKFTHGKWLDKKKGHITYQGDKLKFQNGFGAWENIVYECDLDPATKTVLAVRVYSGHL